MANQWQGLTPATWLAKYRPPADADRVMPYGAQWPADPGAFTSPPVDSKLSGVVSWPDGKGGTSWWVLAGTEAWSTYLSLVDKAEKIIAASAPAAKPAPTPMADDNENTNYVAAPGSAMNTGPANIFAANTGNQASVANTFTNSPTDGVTPIGVPVDNCTLCRIWKWPAWLASKALPPGEVSPVVGNLLRFLPFLFWGGLAWWIYKRKR